MKLLYGVLDMDFETMSFKRYAAEPVHIDRSFGGDTLDLVLNEMPLITNTGISVLGIRLYQGIDDVLYPMNDEKYIGIEVISI